MVSLPALKGCAHIKSMLVKINANWAELLVVMQRDSCGDQTCLRSLYPLVHGAICQQMAEGGSDADVLHHYLVTEMNEEELALSAVTPNHDYPLFVTASAF